MRTLGNMKIRPLEEELGELGLDAGKVLGQISRTTKLVEHRTGGGYAAPFGVPVSDEPGGESQQQQPGGGAVDESEIEEAFKVVRKMFKTAGQKVKEKLARKKFGLAKLRRASKMYRRSAAGRKAKRRQKKKLKKFGSAMLDKLHKMRKRIVMSDETPDTQSLGENTEVSPLQQLRQDLRSIGQPKDQSEDQSERADVWNPYEEAAYNAAVLAGYLGEVFEMSGDTESADIMFNLSDEATDLSEMLDGFDESDALDEDQEERLGKILEGIEKGLRLHEEMGRPTVDQVVEFRMKHDAEAFQAECEDGDGDGLGEADGGDDDDEGGSAGDGDESESGGDGGSAAEADGSGKPGADLAEAS